MILADAGSSHPDSTFSLLRGGISEFAVPKNQPAAFKGALVARIVADRGEAGSHEIKIRCVDEDGGSVTPDFTANFEIPPKGGALHVVMEVATIFPRLGQYSFLISVDKHQLDTWSLEAKELKPPEKK